MAEAFLKQIGGERFTAESAGLEPGELNPVVVEVMRETGIDISMKKTKSVFDLFKQGKQYNYVVTVCDESQAEKCPVFPGTPMTQRLHWGFADPSAFNGTREEKLVQTRQVRDQIKARIEEWVGHLRTV
jgi:arsenate reductase